MRLDRSQVVQPTGAVSVFVGNLSWSVKEEDLNLLFAKWRPMFCQVLTNMYGRSRGFALIKFFDENLAYDAIETVHGMDFIGRKIEVINFLY